MNALNTRIVACYENGDMSVEEIAEEEQLDVVAVKSVLAASSQKYKANVKLTSETDPKHEDITDDELEQFFTAYKQIAFYAEENNVRERALKFLINEKKGRHDISLKAIAQGAQNVNILVVNKHLEAAREAIQRASPKPLPLDNNENNGNSKKLEETIDI